MHGSSLLFLAALTVLAQDGGADDELKSRLKALAAGGASAAEALKHFDSLPVAQLERIHRLAASVSPETRDAARLNLPPSTWKFASEKTIGDARLALAKLASDLRWMKPKQRNPVVLAGKQLVYRGNPSIVPDMLEAFLKQDGSLQEMPIRLLTIFGSADLTPSLVEALAVKEDRPREAVQALLAIGDSRAEKDLLKRLRESPDYATIVLETLSLIGGEETLAELRQRAADPGTPAYYRAAVAEARLRMRDPQLPRDLLAAPERSITESMRLGRALARMGDASVLPDLVKMVEDPKASVHDRNAAIRVIGILGNRDHTPLLADCLQDARVAGTAAEALAEIGDPASSAPLAEALRSAVMGDGFARALLIVPLQNIEGPILEILKDPQGHRMTINHALRVASRIGGTKVRDEALALLTAKGHHFYDDFEVARVLVPLLEAKDSRKLSRSSSPDAPPEEGSAASARLAARAALGHKESREKFVRGLVGMGRSLRYRDENGMEAVHPLLRYPGKLEDLVPEVRAVFKENPQWSAGAQFLARWGHEDGVDLLKSEAAAKKLYWQGVLPELAAPIVWRLMSEDWMTVAGDGELERIGSAMPETIVKSMRETVLAEATDAQAQSQDQRAHPGNGHRNGMTMNSLELGAGIRMGFFAVQGDPVFENLYRWQLRMRLNDDSPGFTVAASAVALAKLRAADMKPTFLRMLRSAAPSKRVLGCRCLGILGDSRSIRDIAPLLDDHERFEEIPARFDLIPLDGRLTPRVCDSAADAIEILSRQKFPGARAERIAAIKTWVSKQ